MKILFCCFFIFLSINSIFCHVERHSVTYIVSGHINEELTTLPEMRTVTLEGIITTKESIASYFSSFGFTFTGTGLINKYTGVVLGKGVVSTPLVDLDYIGTFTYLDKQIILTITELSGISFTMIIPPISFIDGEDIIGKEINTDGTIHVESMGIC
jgi:hypothetical protein